MAPDHEVFRLEAGVNGTGLAGQRSDTGGKLKTARKRVKQQFYYQLLRCQNIVRWFFLKLWGRIYNSVNIPHWQLFNLLSGTQQNCQAVYTALKWICRLWQLELKISSFLNWFLCIFHDFRTPVAPYYYIINNNNRLSLTSDTEHWGDH